MAKISAGIILDWTEEQIDNTGGKALKSDLQYQIDKAHRLGIEGPIVIRVTRKPAF